MLYSPCASHFNKNEVASQSHRLRDKSEPDESEIQLKSHHCDVKERAGEAFVTNSSKFLPFTQINKHIAIRKVEESGLHPLDPNELIANVSCTTLPETNFSSSSDLPSKPVPKFYNSKKTSPCVNSQVYPTSSKLDDVERGERFTKGTSECTSTQINKKRKAETRLRSVHSKEKCQSQKQPLKGNSSMCSVNILCGYIFWNLRKMNLSPKFQTYVITLCSGLLLYVSDLFSDIINGIFLLYNGKKDKFTTVYKP